MTPDAAGDAAARRGCRYHSFQPLLPAPPSPASRPPTPASGAPARAGPLHGRLARPSLPASGLPVQQSGRTSPITHHSRSHLPSCRLLQEALTDSPSTHGQSSSRRGVAVPSPELPAGLARSPSLLRASSGATLSRPQARRGFRAGREGRERLRRHPAPGPRAAHSPAHAGLATRSVWWPLPHTGHPAHYRPSRGARGTQSGTRPTAGPAPPRPASDRRGWLLGPRSPTWSMRTPRRGAPAAARSPRLDLLPSREDAASSEPALIQTSIADRLLD